MRNVTFIPCIQTTCFTLQCMLISNVSSFCVFVLFFSRQSFLLRQLFPLQQNRNVYHTNPFWCYSVQRSTRFLVLLIYSSAGIRRPITVFYRPLFCCVRISRLFALDTWAICKMSKCLRIRKVPVTHWICRLQASFERGWISSAIAPLWCVTLIHLNATYKMCNASNRTWCRLWLTNCGFTSTYILVANASFATNWEYWVESNVSP